MNLSDNKTRRNSKINRKRMLAMSAILGMVIGLGLTAAVGGGVYYIYQDQADVFSSSAQVEVRNLNAIRSGDTLTITANVKNVGSTALTGIYLADVRTGNDFSITTANAVENIMIRSADHEAGTEDNESYAGSAPLCDDINTPATCTDAAGELRVSGVSYSGGDPASLDGGGTNAIRLTVTMEEDTVAPIVIEEEEAISETVTISDRLTLQLGFESGDDDFLSDVYNTRIRPG